MIVTAPTRLHFGLLAVPTHDDTHERAFGGIGLTLDDPCVTVESHEADDWQITGTLAERAMSYLSILPARNRPLAIHAEGPQEHTGLGVGTALGMALAETWSKWDGVEGRSSHDLAAMAGRGLRSGIGVHGFRQPGFVVDPGKRDGEAISPCESFPFPWSVVLLKPKSTNAPWCGEAERQAFARTRDPAIARATRQRLHTLLYDHILPSLHARHFASFAEALGEYNRVAGEPFVAEQGGNYSSPEVHRLISKLQALGHTGVGQSSWGPTVFAVVEDQEQAERVRRQFAE